MREKENERAREEQLSGPYRTPVKQEVSSRHCFLDTPPKPNYPLPPDIDRTEKERERRRERERGLEIEREKYRERDQ